MLKKQKLVFLASLILTALLILSAFLSKKTDTVSAQKNLGSFPTLICEEPIPVGTALEEAFSLINSTYKEFQDASYYTNSASDELKEMLAVLFENEDTVCDFGVCRGVVFDAATSFELKANYIFGEKRLLGVHVPICTPKECIGEPCPDLKDFKKNIEVYYNAILGSYNIIKDLYSKPSIVATWDIRKDNESENTVLRKPEVVRRYLQLAREWLHAIPEGSKIPPKRKSCILSESERVKFSLGELGGRGPMNCAQALESGIYWPKLWSEYCQKECSQENISSPGGLSECKACLQEEKNNDPAASPLAKINYKIYNICNIPCSNGSLNKECLDCLKCENPRFNYAGILQPCRSEDLLSEKELADWLCGGTSANYVCCYETTIETTEKEE